MGYIQLGGYPKGPHGDSQMTQDVAKAMDCPPDTGGKSLLLKTTFPPLTQ